MLTINTTIITKLTLIDELVFASEAFPRAGIVGLEDQFNAVVYGSYLSGQLTAADSLLQLHPPEPVHSEHIHVVEQATNTLMVTSYKHQDKRQFVIK